MTDVSIKGLSILVNKSKKRVRILLNAVHFDLISSSGQVPDYCHLPTSLTHFCGKLELQGPLQTLSSLMTHNGTSSRPFLQQCCYFGHYSAEERL